MCRVWREILLGIGIKRVLVFVRDAWKRVAWE